MAASSGGRVHDHDALLLGNIVPERAPRPLMPSKSKRPPAHSVSRPASSKEEKAATTSGLPLPVVVTANDLVPSHEAKWDPERELGYPGEFPFTRGVYPTMYRGRLYKRRVHGRHGLAAFLAMLVAVR